MSKQISLLNIQQLFFECIKKFKLLILSQFILAIIWALDMSFKPFLIKVILDNIIHYKSHILFPNVKIAILTYLFMSLISFLLICLSSFVWSKLDAKLQNYLGIKLFDRAIQHSPNFFINNFSGNISTKLKDVMSGIPDITKTIFDKISSQFFALMIACYTFWIVASPQFTYNLICWILIYLSCSLKLSSLGNNLYKKASEKRSFMMGQLVDMFSNIMNIKLFFGEHHEKNNFRKILKEYTDCNQARDRFIIRLLFFQGFSFVIYQAVCFYFLFIGIENKIISVGEFAFVVTLNISIVNCLQNLSREINAFVEIYNNSNHSLNILYQPLEIVDEIDAKEIKISKGEVTFNKVNFQYKDSFLKFNDKSITIKSKEKIGIVGYSGSGKTTLVNLILRMFDTDSGEILIDGQNIKKVSQNSLRQSISFVPQDPILFNRSLIDNIRYGKFEANDEEVIKATKLAHAHDFIIKLPNKYNSVVGERGVKLSGGQRQLISIARAIIKNAPILILDEATSHLDSITEANIKSSLYNLMKGKTCIIIAHRLSTVLSMDRILVIEDGKIIQEGSHDNLVKQEGLYKSLWQKQTNGFLPSHQPTY